MCIHKHEPSNPFLNFPQSSQGKTKWKAITLLQTLTRIYQFKDNQLENQLKKHGEGKQEYPKTQNHKKIQTCTHYTRKEQKEEYPDGFYL